MTDHVSVRTLSSARRGALSTLDRVPHLVFFSVVGAASVRLVREPNELCTEIVAVSGLLAVVYAAGLMMWRSFGRPARRLWVSTLLLLWTALMVLNPPPLAAAYAWCGVPLACLVLRALGRRGATVALAGITAVLFGRLSHQAGGFDAELVLIPVAAVWGTVTLYRTMQRDAAERQRLLAELRGTRRVLAAEQRRAGALAERERIARDLHDTLAQELAGHLMLLHAAERDLTERPDAARDRVRAAVDGLDAGLAETRRIIHDLTPSAVVESGLEDSLRLLCGRAQQEGTARCVTFRSVGARPAEVSVESAATLFRIAQSSLANVREHARAGNVLVTLRQRQGTLELELLDDGIGFVPDAAVAAAARGRGLGLPAARARLRELDGDLHVDSAPGRGTRIRAVVASRRRSGRALPAATAVNR
ncbi:sensor histidine kinase [Streptomyces sp. B21-102]|uniref:sensor histidine kinase n=1 Tax=Streptomyces sp. B21-102 TaxID=3039416 RepID=UPI002FF0D6F5